MSTISGAAISLRLIMDRADELSGILGRGEEIIESVRNIIGYLDPSATSEQLQRIEEHAALVHAALTEARSCTGAFRAGAGSFTFN